MEGPTTPAPAFVTSPPLAALVPEMVTKATAFVTDGGDFGVFLAVTVGAVLLLLLCVVTSLLWCLSRRKGSYSTNETEDEDDDDDDEESDGSDTSIQGKEPLRV